MLRCAVKTSLLISFMLNGCLATSSLRVCPCDTVVNSNETVHLHCAAEPGHVIRWYRGTNFSDVIYTGKSLVRIGATDDRYDVQRDDSGNVDLCIRAVKASDGGVYKCRDMKTNEETDVNIVVVDPLTANVQQNSPNVRNCSFTFYGKLKPVVEWLDESGQLLHDVISQTAITDHVVESTTEDTRAAECQLTFQAFSCGQLAHKIHLKLHQKLLATASTSTAATTSTASTVVAPAVAEPWRDAMTQLSWISINSSVLFVWAVSATVVVVILLCVTFWQRFKNRTQHTSNHMNSLGQSDESLVKPPLNISTHSGPGVYEILNTSCVTVAGLNGITTESNTEHGCYSQLKFAVYDSINNTPPSDNNQQHTVEQQSSEYMTLLAEQ